jgi:cytochrome c5
MAVAIAAAVVMMAGGLAANREARNGEAVQFVSADKSAISVQLGHQASAEKSGTFTVDAGCKACHSL